MSQQKATSPVTLLKEIENCCRGCDSGFPRKVEVSYEWSGIAFRLGHNNLIVSMDDVVEILDVPDISVVPLTQSWMRGIANLRGKLLPVIDLNGYLGKGLTRMTNRTRVLVIDLNGIYSGLVVDDVMGLKYFLEDELTDEAPGVDDEILPYIRSVFHKGRQVWGVFSLLSLSESPQFLQAAV